MTSLTRAERALAPMDEAIVWYLRSTPHARRIALRQANAQWRKHREAYGYTSHGAILTPQESQAKLGKSEAPTIGLTLAPARLVASDLVPVPEGQAFDAYNLCPWATAGCLAACLNTAGKGSLDSNQRARIIRTRFVLTQPASAGVKIAHELLAMVARHGAVLFRPNVTSDIRWEYVLSNAMPRLRRIGVTMYDYSKAPVQHRSGEYHVTFSAHERMRDSQIHALVERGVNVAVVFATSKAQVKAAVKAGATWQGIPLADGVSTDDRTRDGKGVVVALAALGDALKDRSGFVRAWDVALAA